jgi:drug/metabolite transporter (DMT)-like permease
MPASLVLVFALVGISFAGPLVRLSHAHPLAIAIWRIAFSMGIVGTFLLITGGWRQWKRLDRAGLTEAIAAGAMLALHFWTWNASIGLTTVSASVVLVNLQPAIVAILSTVWLREPPTDRQWLGIIVAMLGAAVVAVPDLEQASTARSPLIGDLLAVAGAVTASVYFVIGRRLRATLDLWPYVSLVYGSCLIVLLALAVAVHAPVAHQPQREMAIFAALAIGPMLLGHTGLNWALRYLPAYVVNLTLLGEPIGATILAAAIPAIREVPSSMTVVGGALILAGIYVTTRSTPRMPAVAPPSAH